MSKYGTTLTPEAYKAMSYTTAVVKETLRLAQVVAYVPRMATKPLDIPNGGPTLPSGCPFIVALASISAADPALHKNSSSSSSEGVVEQFEPERCVAGGGGPWNVWKGAVCCAVLVCVTL